MNMSLDDVGIKCLENRVQIFSGMNIEADRTGKIKREDAHDRFCVDDITSGHEIKIIVKFGEVIHKGLDLVNGIQGNCYCFHNLFLFLSGAEHFFQDVFFL